MSAYTPKARDDFPLLADFARRPSGWDSALIDRRREAGRALDEIDTLRRELDKRILDHTDLWTRYDRLRTRHEALSTAISRAAADYGTGASDPVSIDAVAALIRNAWPFQLATSHAPALARALAEAGLLRAPADEILTEADRAVLDAADEETAAEEHEASWDRLIRARDRRRAAVARRVAAGGTAPTDPHANRNEMENPAMTTTANQDTAPPPDTTPEGLLYTAWTIIANAGHNRGGWEAQDPEWVTAAQRWRDQWHATL